MPRVSIARLRPLIRTLDYDASSLAADDLDDDQLGILALETIILSGTIIERQRERLTP